MTAAAHVYEIFIAAPQQRVWDALVEPGLTTQYFHGTQFESSWQPGARYLCRVASSGHEAVDGEIEVFDPPNRLVMTWHVLYDAAMAEEPPSRVEWMLSAGNDEGTVTRVTLRHGDLASSPKTWENVRVGWVGVIDGLKTLLETGAPMPPVDTARESGAEPIDVAGGWHRAQAIEANNSTWELLDARAHTPDETDDLLDRAYAAQYHWQRATGCTAVNRTRASWLLSRAHVVLGHGELALHHAERCRHHLTDAGDAAADFDRVYAHEATARALACLGRVDEARVELAAARAIEIADAEDRSILESDLDAEPWFGV